ncbi:MAG: serine protease [Bacteroidetes bacterium]|nr:serine protease [Bacteroidota bacterium]
MDWLIIVGLIILGFILIILEVFALPGIIVGIFGVISIIVAIVYSFIQFDANTGLLILLGTIAFSVVFTYALFKLGAWNRFILGSQQKREEGFTSAETENSLLGKVGTAQTNLRPAGSALIDGKKYDVLADGEFLQKGDSIVVTSVSGIKVTVKKKEE